MPELRYDISSQEWVIFATERAKRPTDFIKSKKSAEPVPEYRDNCPFCPGNEDKTPGEIDRIDAGAGWKVRTVPNLFGALSEKERPERHQDEIYLSLGGFGEHEVIIENRRHNTCAALMSPEEIRDVVRMYRSRYEALRSRPGIESIIIFKNHGPGAGTSLEHPHSQVIATPIVPPYLRRRTETAAGYFDTNGRCVHCRMLEEEIKRGTRVVHETGRFVSFLPYAGVWPFLTWIVPKRHASSFDEVDENDVAELADSLHDVLGRLYHGLGNPDFNYTVHSLPAKEKATQYLHWYLSIIPRLSQPAGFELGSGMFINSSRPEESAEFLRQVKSPQV